MCKCIRIHAYMSSHTHTHLPPVSRRCMCPPPHTTFALTHTPPPCYFMCSHNHTSPSPIAFIIAKEELSYWPKIKIIQLPRVGAAAFSPHLSRAWPALGPQALAPRARNFLAIPSRGNGNEVLIKEDCMCARNRVASWICVCDRVCEICATDCVYACVCMHVYVCMCMHVCVCMCVYACVCMHVYVCMCMYACVCAYVHELEYLYLAHIRTSMTLHSVRKAMTTPITGSTGDAQRTTKSADTTTPSVKMNNS